MPKVPCLQAASYSSLSLQQATFSVTVSILEQWWVGGHCMGGLFAFAQLIHCLGLKYGSRDMETAMILSFFCYCILHLRVQLAHLIWIPYSFPLHTTPTFPSYLGLSVCHSYCFLSFLVLNLYVMVLVYTFSTASWHQDKGLLKHSHKGHVWHMLRSGRACDLWINSRNVREFDFGASSLPR